MLRVTTLYASTAAATANYYTQYLTQAPGEVAGVWTGDQAAALGLSGSVTAESLRALLEGRDPVHGTRLGYPLTDRVLTDGRVVRAVAGFDATFSAPKSVSVLWALTQDQRLLDAHDAAVTVALSHLERYGSTTRVRADGRRLHPDSQGLMIATFRQSTSRADDPQLHTHAVISAKVQTDDGRWLALDARYLKRHQRMLGGLYQSALRSELVNRSDSSIRRAVGSSRVATTATGRPTWARRLLRTRPRGRRHLRQPPHTNRRHLARHRQPSNERGNHRLDQTNTSMPSMPPCKLLASTPDRSMTLSVRRSPAGNVRTSAMSWRRDAMTDDCSPRLVSRSAIVSCGPSPACMTAVR